MKNITKLTLAAVAVLTFCVSGFSQKALVKADEAFDARQYYLAAQLYKNAYSSVDKAKKGLVLYRSGLCSQRINDYRAAEAYYNKSIAAGFDDPNVYFQLAQILKNLQKYPEAIVEFKNYKSKGGDSKKADLGVKSCELAQQWMDNPMRYKTENISLVNSKNRDYAPCFSDKKYKTIVISSNREGALGSQDANTGYPKGDLWESKLDKNGKWSTPVLLPPSVSTDVNEGRAWVSKKGDMIFFTRCPEEKGMENQCGLFMAKKQGSTWGVPERLPFSNDTITFAHPTLSADNKTLYFTSNLKGGYGKLDIWSCTYDPRSNSWGQPKNAGPTVNTEGMEVYPALTDDGKKLYFSSDFHPGLGGLDIFLAEIGPDGKTSKPVENLKYPINSSYDDFGIVFEGRKNRGYFTSNREGGKGDDDIWSFSLPPLVFNAKGNVFSEGDPNTGKGKAETVEAVKVKMVGSDGSITEAMTGKDGAYAFKLKERTTYSVSTETSKSSKSPSYSKDGYLSSKDLRVFTTVGLDQSQDFSADFAVKPIVPNPRMPEVRYELGDYKLLADSKDSLNYLFDLMTDNPSTVVELNSHTDTRGSAVSNMTLSAARAQSCVDFLVKEKGINPKRLIAKGYGLTQPIIADAVIAKEPSKEGKEALHAKNRRTSFKILSFDFVDPNASKNPVKPKKATDDEDEDEE
ncbi:OmpA family protein [Aurantibacillus circumpalustris]|uniref:OmpA family protein n=1 Tax=Aurantibacillus circumpalustris TaxID=3036359 RepID=UPI00295AD97E|nr:OmpA family protein [Aurantibacillus circumpalustris]